MSSRNGDQPRLRITDMTDRELVVIIWEMAQPWVSAREISDQIWPRRSDDHTRLSVLRRLAYMRKRAGLVEKHEKERDLWRLTDRGEQFASAKLRAAQIKALNATGEDELVEVLALVGDRYRDLGEESAWLLRREWQHRLARR